MDEFTIPARPEDLGVGRDGVFCVQRPVDVHRMKPAKLASLIDAAAERLHQHPLAITEESTVFDLFYSILSTFKEATSDTKERLVVAISQAIEEVTGHIKSQLSSEAALRPEMRSSRSSLKGVVFLAQWFVNLAEEEEVNGGPKKTDKTWNWSNSKDMLISPLSILLKLDLARLWGLDLPSEDFVGLLTSLAYNMLENSSNVRSKQLRDIIFGIVVELTVRYGHAAGAPSKILHLLTKHEHLSAPLAILMSFLGKGGADAVVVEVFNEIGNTDSRALASDAASARYMSIFLGECAVVVSNIMLANLPVLLLHLDGDSHSLRSGVVHVCGRLLSRLSLQKKEEKGSENESEELIQVIMDRMVDVSAFVRSRALQTWTGLFTDHAVPLKMVPTITKSAVIRLHDKAALVRRSALQTVTTALQYNPYGASLPLSTFNSRLQEIEKRLEEESEVDEKLTLLAKFHGEAVAFVTEIESAVPSVSDLLGSRTLSDVTEAIQFFITARQFNIESATAGLRKMLHLVWSRDPQISDAAESACRQLYLSPEPVDGTKQQKEKAASVHVAKSFVVLTRGANLAELTSLTELIGRLSVGSGFPSGTTDALWAIFTGKLVVEQGREVEDKRGALGVIGMIAATDPPSLARRIDVLSDHALSPTADSETVRLAAVALGKLWGKNNEEKQAKLPATHTLVQKLIAQVLKQCDIDDVWFGMVEEALNTLYHMTSSPGVIVAGIVKTIASPLISGDSEVSAGHLSRILFIVGHVALRQLVWMEENEVEHAKQVAKPAKKDKSSSLEEAAGGSNTLDSDAEYVASLQENDIVGANLLGLFGPVIVKVCEGIGGKYQNTILSASAALALCKFMATSAAFCRDNLRLFVTMMGSDQSAPLVRANMAIGFGDLAFRHPNLIEPYTEHIYSRLRDPDVRVRRHTLMVLTHLILNDMVKVKGQIYEMAARIVDQDDRIGDLARLFFQELAAKGNALYNLLPDIISQLSTGSGAVGQDDFREIQRYLLSFIKKERQLDALIDKLCRRFGATMDLIQWQNLGFCLCQLSVNERGVKKMIELFSFYSPSLFDDDVYNSFKSILTKARKTVKVEQRQIIDDLEVRLDGVHEKSAEDHAVDVGAARVADKAVARYGEKVAKEIEEREAKEKEVVVEEEEPKPVGRGRGRGRGGRKVAVPPRGARRRIVTTDDESSDSEPELLDVSDSSSSSEEEEEEVPERRNRRRAQK